MAEIIHGEWLGSKAPANYRITLPDEGEQRLVDQIRVGGQYFDVTGGFEMGCAAWSIEDGALSIEP